MGNAGYLEMSNQKSIMRKYTWTRWPFNLSCPPYTEERAKRLQRYFSKLDMTEGQFMTRVVIFVKIVIFLICLRYRKLSYQTYKKYNLRFKLLGLLYTFLMGRLAMRQVGFMD